jgi:hypothetical protein
MTRSVSDVGDREGEWMDASGRRWVKVQKQEWRQVGGE